MPAASVQQWAGRGVLRIKGRDGEEETENRGGSQRRVYTLRRWWFRCARNELPETLALSAGVVTTAAAAAAAGASGTKEAEARDTLFRSRWSEQRTRKEPVPGVRAASTGCNGGFWGDGDRRARRIFKRMAAPPTSFGGRRARFRPAERNGSRRTLSGYSWASKQRPPNFDPQSSLFLVSAGATLCEKPHRGGG